MRRRERGRFGTIASLALAAAATAAIAIVGLQRLGRAGTDMVPRSMSSAALDNLATGRGATLMLRVTERSDHQLIGTLLQKSGRAFANSGTTVAIDLDDKTSVVMGGTSDLRPGAVVQASGFTEGQRSLRAKQLVILTGFVAVAPESAG